MLGMKLWLIVIVFSLTTVVFTLLIAKYTKKRPYKYIPSAILGLIAIGLFVKSFFFSNYKGF